MSQKKKLILSRKENNDLRPGSDATVKIDYWESLTRFRYHEQIHNEMFTTSLEVVSIEKQDYLNLKH